jgi:hypothetical protein
MGRIWNLLGWLTITLIVPGMIFATMNRSEEDVLSMTHSATCKTCSACRGGSQLPCVIDGNNLRVINPEVSAANTNGAKLPHHL